MDILNQKDIDTLLNEIDRLYQPTKSIIEMTPHEIDLIKDESIKEDTLKHFYEVDFLYVKPLEKLLKYALDQSNSSHYSYDLSNQSILDRIKILSKLLFSYGYVKDQLIDLVPQTKEDVNIILTARRKGYKDQSILSHIDRLEAVNSFLDDYRSHKK